MEEVTLVDEQDNEIGVEEKLAAHVKREGAQGEGVPEVNPDEADSGKRVERWPTKTMCALEALHEERILQMRPYGGTILLLTCCQRQN